MGSDEAADRVARECEDKSGVEGGKGGGFARLHVQSAKQDGAVGVQIWFDQIFLTH